MATPAGINQKTTNDIEKKLELLKMSQAANLLGSWEWDLKTNKLFWTDEMFILPAAPVSTNNLISIEENYQFIVEEDREMVKAQFESLQQKDEVNFEYHIRAKDGKVKTVLAWATMIRGEDGTPLFIRGTSQDITQEREYENQLRELNLALEYAEEIANLGNWQWKLKTDQLIISKNLYRLLGCEPYEFQPSFENLLKFVHPDDKNKLDQLEIETLNQGRLDIECRVIRKDGSERHMRSNVQLMNISAEEALVQGTVQDITQETLVRKQLEQKSSFAEMLIENSVDHIAAYDSECRMIAWNRKCEERYGKKKEDVLGKYASDVYPDLKPNQLNDIQRALHGEFVYESEQKSSSFPGLIEYFIIPLKDSNNHVFGALSILHDLSALQQSTDKLNELNQSLEVKNKELERSNDEMASFSYVASHDLQEPLRKIHTFSRLILDKEFNALSEKGKDYFRRMETAALRMQTLIDDLLTFSRTNTMPREFKPTDLNKILLDVKKEIKDSIDEKNAVIESTPLPEISVIGFQFKQLLENLLLNSIKYSKPDVPPQIKIIHEKLKGSNTKIDGLNPDLDYFKISVIDNGIGFEPEYSEKIFELFQRLHSKHEYPGTGLGLAICRKIVHNHHGVILAESNLGKGACFHIYIPAK